jgi:hypothetical protein
MKASYKEGIYFILTLLISLLTFVFLFGIENIKSGDLVLNVHSTYFGNKGNLFFNCFCSFDFFNYLLNSNGSFKI